MSQWRQHRLDYHWLTCEQARAGVQGEAEATVAPNESYEKTDYQMAVSVGQMTTSSCGAVD